MIPIQRASVPRIYAKADSGESGRPWYNMAKAETAGQPIEVMIYDDIGGWGLRAADFIRELKALDDGKSAITVAIDSDGGDVFDGFAISNALARLGDRCTVRIDGLAASAASVIACGAHRVVMAENTMMMIHNPWTWASGDAEELRKTADVLDKVTGGLLATYRAKAPKMDAATLKTMLDAETWLSPYEAVALGLADEISGTSPVKARALSPILAKYRKLPQALMAKDKPADPVIEPAPKPIQEPSPNVAALAARLTQACIQAGHPQLAEVLIVSTALKDEATVAAEVSRIEAVSALCLTAKLPELAADYLKAGLGADAVRARLFDRLVADDVGEINNREPMPSEATPQAKTPNPTDIYAARKGKPKADTKGCK
ncbi:Clp protease ClpP [Chitinimonas arctica]|uniref:Clp protease ClpP n=1 Tax=Chitinimonas arctica TaxID=2594795 RepID=A0A516SJA4_9NEIS|nr:head maturation protease, ClpP-related [Chitinimonas arctica]QDQ28235.1 Clp protease ClpP [Chitinimonas arctica]